MKTSPSCSNVLRSGLAAVLLSTATAATYDWDGNGARDAGGNWSATNNWNPDSTAGGPTTGDTANLVDTTTNRTITYDAAATGSLTTLNINQTTAGITNTLDVQRNLTNTALLTLGAVSATERIIIGSTASTGYIFNPSGGLTLNAGGNLVMSATGNGTTGVNFGNTGGGGLLTVQGGTLTIAGTTGTTSAGSAANTLSMGFTMTSGALTIDNTNGIADRRLLIQGTVNVSGGAVSTTRTGGGGAITFSTTNAIAWNPTTFDTDITLTLETTNAQSLTTDKTLFVVQARGTGVKTLTSTAAGNGIAQLQLFDANNGTTNSRTTLRLGSNLTSTTNASMPVVQNFGNSPESGRIDVGIDPGGFLLNLSAGTGSGAWTPNASGQSGVSNTVWTLGATGTIRAGSFNFSSSNVTTDVSADLVLEAVGGNSSANNLGGNGTFGTNATTVFRYAGTAATNAPATLTSSRNLGDIEVTSGALRLLTNSVGTVQDLRVIGGTFDLQGGTNTFVTISLTGGTLANGSFQTAETNFTGLQTGTVSGALIGAKKLIKNSAGTLTLSGFNNFSNNAMEVLAGTVLITTPNAVNGSSTLDAQGGTIDLGGTTVNKFITITNGGAVLNGTIQRATPTTWTLHDGTLGANLTVTGTNVINITKAGAGTLVMSGTNAGNGSLSVTAGTLDIVPGGSMTFLIGGNGTNNALGGTTNGTALINGQFVFNLAAASTNVGDSWTIVAAAVNETYGTNFLVSGFNGAGGNWTNTTNGVNYVFAQSNGILSVQSNVVGNYASWVTYWQGVDPGFTNTAGTDNPDGDPFDNNEEFAFDGNPTVGTGALLTAAKVGTNAVFNYVARKNPPGGATYQVQNTPNLAAGPWTNSPVTVSNSVDQSNISQTNNYERKEFVVPAATKDFYRVEASVTP